jgi:hypothetical protein
MNKSYEEYPRLPKEVSEEIASRLEGIDYTYRGESYHEWPGVLERG